VLGSTVYLLSYFRSKMVFLEHIISTSKSTVSEAPNHLFPKKAQNHRTCNQTLGYGLRKGSDPDLFC